MNEPLTWASFKRRTPQDPPLIMAHRGAQADAPENTLAAFALALAQGAHIIETDLHFSRDHHLMLMHDPTIDRTMEGAGRVGDLTLFELKKFRARRPPSYTSTGKDIPFGEAGLGIPTLAELLQLTPAPLALELKDARFAQREDAERLVKLLEQHDALERCVLVSFHLNLLQSVKAVAPPLRIGMITLTNPFPLYPTDFVGPLFPLLYLNPLYVWWARKLGKLACPLDPAPEPRLKFYKRLGVPVLLTNHPAKTAQAIAEVWR
jgi:glycerophosphoryl diester phosphodiesterase